MGIETNQLYDGLLQLKDAGLVAATAVAQVGGSNRIIDLGDGDAAGDVVIDISAIETASTDEIYTIILEGNNTSNFGSGKIEELVSMQAGAGAVLPGTPATTTVVGRYLMPFRNTKNGTRYRYVRIETVVGGTIATGINYTAYISKSKL